MLNRTSSSEIGTRERGRVCAEAVQNAKAGIGAGHEVVAADGNPNATQPDHSQEGQLRSNQPGDRSIDARKA
jgi:hypothetical protein